MKVTNKKQLTLSLIEQHEEVQTYGCAGIEEWVRIIMENGKKVFLLSHHKAGQAPIVQKFKTLGGLKQKVVCYY